MGRSLKIIITLFSIICGLFVIPFVNAETNSVSVSLIEGKQVQAGNLPLFLTQTKSTSLAVEVTPLQSPIAEQLSPFGIAFALNTTSSITTNSPVTLTIAYDQLPMTFGGSIAERLTLYQAIGCREENITVPNAYPRVVEIQSVVQCDEWIPLAGKNDLTSQQLHVFIDQLSTTRSAEQIPDALYVLGSVSASTQSNYGYTPFAAVSDYQVSLNSGAMTTGYTIPVPPARAGTAPTVVLQYNSGIVDGMHSQKNNQPSTLGIGWTLQEGYINRQLKGCATAQAPGDLCLMGEEAYSIVLNGVSSKLVKESGNFYRLENDPYWRVEKRNDALNGHHDQLKEYWLVTTPDGTKYRFGGEFVTEKGSSVSQNSLFYVPVYDTTSNCFPTYDINALCNRAWRWNLDRVEDSNGNVVNYFYEVELNYYTARNDTGAAFRRQYVRAGQLARIEYMTTLGDATSLPQARVIFNSELRCFNPTLPTDPTTAKGCRWNTLGTIDLHDFLDTPSDLACGAIGNCTQNRPTFWTQRRIGSIQTQIFDTLTNRWNIVAHYNLEQGFPQAAPDTQGDISEPKLWLGSISHHPGGDFSWSPFTQIEAEAFDQQSGINTENTSDIGGGRNIGWTNPTDYLLFRAVDFDVPSTSVIARVASATNGTVASREISFRLDSPTGQQIAAIVVPNTGGWQSWKTIEATTSSVNGIHDLYLVFNDQDINLNWFRFNPPFSSSGNHEGLTGVKYDYAMLENRVDYNIAGVSPMRIPRLDKIVTEVGGVVDVTYGHSHPCPQGSNGGYVRYPYDCTISWDSGDPNSGADDAFVLWHKWKVMSYQTSDSFSGNPSATWQYSYSTPTSHYSEDAALPAINDCQPNGLGQCSRATNHWNDWRGSERVTVTAPDGTKTEHRFYRGMNGDRFDVNGGTYSASILLSDGSTRADEAWLRGQTVETRGLTSADLLLSRTVNSFFVRPTILPHKANFVAIEQSETAQDGKTTRTGSVYDAYGNVTRKIEYGDLATSLDDRNQEINYLYNTASYIVNRPASQRLWVGITTGVLADVQQYSRYAYDNLPFDTPPTKGNQTKQRVYWQTSPSEQFYETTTSYDSVGRPTTITDARGGTTTTVFDPFYGYVRQQTNALGQSENSLFDPAWGVPLQTTDANQATTTLRYDDYGRLQSVWYADQTTTDPASIFYTYSGRDVFPAFVKSDQLTDRLTATYLSSWDYFDGFGRKMQTQGSSPTAGQRTVTSQKYDLMGRPLYQSGVYEGGGDAGTGYLSPDWNGISGYTEMLYEDRGRPKSTLWRDGATPLWETAHAVYSGWVTTVTDANGHGKQQESDAFGQLVRVTEYVDGGTPTTLYQYDVRGALIRIEDAAGNVTTMTYDLLGRKTGMNDPDMESWSYQYDANGNLITQTDARGQTVTHVYDALNRLITKSYSTGGAIHYVYDEAGHGAGVGRLTSLTDLAGSHQYQYDLLGRTVSETRIIPFAPMPYTQQYRYDAAGRLEATTYPDGEVVTNQYNAQGLPERMVGTAPYIAYAAYTPRGQILSLQRGNGVDTDYFYHGASEQFRLQRHNDAALDQWYHDYDRVGNLLQMASRYGTEGAEPLQEFSYDALNRLTGAGGAYNRSYSYDAIGNITSMDGRAYLYTAGKPHAVSQIGSDLYSYDANGNMVGRVESGKSYVQQFNGENQLGEVSKAGVQLQFNYDHSGQRLFSRKIEGSRWIETFYPFPTYEQVVENIPTATALQNEPMAHRMNISALVVAFAVLLALWTWRYRKGLWVLCSLLLLTLLLSPSAFAETLIVGTSRSNYFFNGQVVAVRTIDNVSNSVVYLHNDQLGSSTVETDESGAVVAGTVAKFGPYGEYRQKPTTTATEIGFTGHRQNDEVGLIYANARYYLPSTGRFISADMFVPNAADSQFLNRYSYTLNNPLRYHDPSGHAPSDVLLGVADFTMGTLIQIGYDNALLPDVKRGLAPRAGESIPMTAGRIVGSLISVGQGVAEMFSGGGLMGGGVAVCATGVGCLATPVVEAAGIALVGHGALVASSGIISTAGNVGRMISYAATNGDSSDNDSDKMVTVGRWMSENEHETMVKTGRVIESRSSQTHILYKNEPEGFERQAPSYSRYIEFDIPKNSYRITNSQTGWGVVDGPNGLAGRYAIKRGTKAPQMPQAYNIRWTRSRIPH